MPCVGDWKCARCNRWQKKFYEECCSHQPDDKETPCDGSRLAWSSPMCSACKSMMASILTARWASTRGIGIVACASIGSMITTTSAGLSPRTLLKQSTS